MDAKRFPTDCIEVRKSHESIIIKFTAFTSGLKDFLSEPILDGRMESEEVKNARNCAACRFLTGEDQKTRFFFI